VAPRASRETVALDRTMVVGVGGDVESEHAAAASAQAAIRRRDKRDIWR
jgi:hypothetical protein